METLNNAMEIEAMNAEMGATDDCIRAQADTGIGVVGTILTIVAGFAAGFATCATVWPKAKKKFGKKEKVVYVDDDVEVVE